MIFQVWDFPLRLFHWLLVLCVTISFITGNLSGLWLELHINSGILIISLLVFRIIWGFWGNYYAKFIHFFPTPKRLATYFSAQWNGYGHSPIGGVSVFIMLIALVTQACLGMFSMNDEIETNGPFYSLISTNLSEQLTSWHSMISEALLFIIGLHLLAICYYTIYKGRSLIQPMITGDVEIQKKPHDITKNNRYISRFLVALIISLLIYWSIKEGVIVQWISPYDPELSEEVTDW